jgi:uncharacterized integral membrane protein
MEDAMQFFLFLALILALALMLFSVQNSEIITLNLLQWTFQGSLALILVIAFTAGMLAGIFTSLPSWWRKIKVSRAQKKRIHELERELINITEHKLPPQQEETEELEQY